MKKVWTVASLVVMSSLGCSSGTEVNGSVNGKELAASDAVYFEEGTDSTPVRRVVIADEGDLCDLLLSGDAPEGMISLEIRIVGLGGDDADFPVALPGDGEVPYAEARWTERGDASSGAQAASGSVVTDGADGDALEAEFELDFGEAGSLDGTVAATRCAPDAE